MPSEKNISSLDFLRKSTFFASFSGEQLAAISSAASHVFVQADKVVFRQGDHSATMYLILRGGVRIEHGDAGRGRFVVAELSESEVFGEIALLSRQPRHATVFTLKDSEFMAIDRDLMLDVIRMAGPDEIIEIFSTVSEHLRAANDREFRQLLSRRTLASQMEAEKQRALTEMVAGVAHEINTPLGVINAAVSVMARELAVPKDITVQRAADIAESLELIRRSVERAHRLVQDFKRVSVSQLKDEKELFDISEAVEETVNLMLVSLKRGQVAVNFTSRLALEQKNWTGYRGVLSQILINLLTNVERHAYPNGVGGDVDVTLEMADDKQYCLTVQDYGKGISTENLPRIFEPFFTTGRSNGGTGLGLAIVHNLVTNVLKGDIRLKPDLQKGCAFQVVFPRALPDQLE
ncbi:MAG: cyclic nucleotide-binding domain-containing protein [Chloroflexi bacterium]|nr:cyclic nucleotide-binding domain-containing protein [Chloroflexota bacterium]